MALEKSIEKLINELIVLSIIRLLYLYLSLVSLFCSKNPPIAFSLFEKLTHFEERKYVLYIRFEQMIRSDHVHLTLVNRA